MSRTLVVRTSVIAALALVVLVSPIVQPTSRAQTEQIYLALGDSIPAGLLASLPAERGYVSVLHDLIEAERMASDAPGNVNLVNLAEPGETIETFLEDGQLAEALDEIENAPEGSLRTVTLTIGGNNILSLWESTAIEREAELEVFESGFSAVVEQLADALEDHDADVVVTTYYDLTEGDASAEGSNAWWLRQFNEVIADTVQEAGFAVVDLESLFRNRISALTWFPADIHPNNAGHQLIARAIWQELNYDDSPPEVEITRPAEGEVRNRVPTVYATVSDDVGIDSVIVQVDDEAIDELIYVRRRDAWIGVWDARDFPGTEATISVVATDVSGNESSDSVTVTLPSS